MTSIEDRLRDAMAAKAETVRDDGRPRALPTPRRRPSRGRWWAPLAVAVAIVTVVAGIVLGTRAVSPPAPAVRPTPPGPYVGPIAPPIKKVWPGAVHEIPTTGPGGRAFKPDVFVSSRVVVGRGFTRNRPDGIWSYDLDRRAFSRVAPLKELGVANEPVVFGSGFVAWSALRDSMTEIWAVPVTGGVPRRVTAFSAVFTGDSYQGIELAIADSMAVWSPSNGGVYQVRLAGGRPAPVKGTKGYHLLAWPWAGRPKQEWMPDQSVSRPMEHLIDVRTGERDDAVHPRKEGWQDCGVTWCVNSREAWRRDGTGLRELPGNAAAGIYSDRFVLLHQKGTDGKRATAVHDIATGRTGILGLLPTRMGERAFPTVHVQDGMFWYQRDGRQVVVNLNGIR